jgi:drug/metabolite transporter (DMT)-like permease
MESIFLVAIIVIVSCIIGSVGSLFLKLGSSKFNIKISVQGIREILRNWQLIFGIGLYVFSAMLFMMAIKMEDISIVYPMTSVGYIFITILSRIFLKEQINNYKILGILCILLGVVFVTL